MTYKVMANIQSSSGLRTRVTACAAQQAAPQPYEFWVNEHLWDFAVQPGWDDAWASAQASHADDESYDPGSDEAVITDAQILAAVQALNKPEASS